MLRPGSLCSHCMRVFFRLFLFSQKKQNFLFRPAFLFPLQKEKVFSPAQRAFFCRFSIGRVFSPAAQAGSILQPPLLFLLPEKEERAAGVEEKEGFARSVYPATPTGAVRLFVKHCFSCGLCPKDAAAGRSCVSILWHLSGRIQYLPHPLAAAALMQKHIRKHFQIAPRPLIKTYLFAAALSVAKLLPALFFFVPCTARFFFWQRKRNVGCIRTPAHEMGEKPPACKAGKCPLTQ